MTDPLASALLAFWGSLESPHSRRGYQADWDRYTAWLASEKLHALTVKPSDVQRYLGHLTEGEKARSTRARALSVIRSVYDALIRYDVTANNPARAVKNPRKSTTPTTPWLEAPDLAKFAAVLSADKDGDWRARRNRLCVLLFIGVAWRRSEIARLAIEDFKGGVVSGIVKRNKEARTGVPAWLQHEIDAWCTFAGLGETGPLLPSREGSPMSISESLAYEIVKDVARRAGMPAVTPHSLRRTFITILRKRGVSWDELQHAVAHDSSRTTELYDHGVTVSAPGDALEDLVYGSKEGGK